MTDETAQTADGIQQAIARLEAQRALLGDTTVDAAVSALNKQLAMLNQQTPPQRKQITILFADVSGYTALSGAMDAEDVTELMNSLWQQLDGAIVSHNGRVDKHIGDGVMAVWGTATAREDDPEQAILAALAMQTELADFRQRYDINIAMRIGINTGLALLTEVGTLGEYTAIGNPVNVASRLEQAAPVGSILISHDTYQHIRGIFDITPQPPLTVKGVGQPLQTYIVAGLKQRAFRLGTRGIEGVVTRTIGRQAEMGQLQQALETAVIQHRRTLITLVGEAGMGKSRLLYEFDAWIELRPERFTYFKGRARQEIRHVPYALLRDLFAFRFQIQDNDPGIVVRQKLEDNLGAILGSGAPAHIIGHLLGYDFHDSPHLANLADNAELLQQQALRHLATFFQQLSQRQPTVILLEDIHWADDSSLDLLLELAQIINEQPLFICGAARPDFFERRPAWANELDNHSAVRLTPLSRTDSYLLVAEILQRAETVPDTIPQTIVNKAEGNPFYIEELVKMLIESGVIRNDTTPWHFDLDALNLDQLPTTLTALLQARVDRLPVVEKTALQGAAVIGRIFWDDAVRLLAGRLIVGIQSPPANVGDALGTLRQREIIYPRDSSAFTGTQEFIFKHTMLREVTYEGVLKRHRRLCHRLAAEWLLTHSGDRVTEFTGVIADHLEMAEEVSQAAVYLRRAGDQAAAQFANTEAIAYYTRALHLTPESDAASRYKLLLAREKRYHLLGAREEQLTDLRAMQALAEANPDQKWTTAVMLRQANYHRALSNHKGTIAAAKTAVSLAKQHTTPEQEAEGLLAWAWGLLGLGHYDEARPLLQEAYQLAQDNRLLQFVADSLRNLGYIPWHQGNYDEARLYFAQALSAHRLAGDKAGESAALNNLGLTARHQGDYSAARDYYEQSLEIKVEIGDRQGEGTTLNNLGLVCWIEGDYPAARLYYERSLHIKREIKDRRGMGTTLNNLGLAAMSLGDYAAARTYYDRALTLHRTIDDRQGEGLVLENLSLLHHYLDENEAAGSCAQQALKIALELDARTRQAFALTNMGHAAYGSGSYPQARTAYGQALVIRRDLRQPNLMMEALAGLAQVALAERKQAEAQTHIETILTHLETSDLDGADDPFRIYLTCYRVLTANRDGRATPLLTTTHEQLQARAARIRDEALRRRFLHGVAQHREIISLWQNQTAT